MSRTLLFFILLFNSLTPLTVQSQYKKFAIPVRFDIVINEILYAPLTGNTEWFEIYNRSLDTLNINNWKMADAATFSSPVIITTQDHFLLPGDYFILCQDTSQFNGQFGIPGIRKLKPASWPALNNTGDMLVVFDLSGAIIDSLTFSSGWGGASGGKSLERKHADSSSTTSANWGSATAVIGATPGSYNSVSPKQFDLSFSPAHPG